LKFYNKAVRFGLPFYLVCDFESFLTTLDNDEEDVDAKKATNLINEHNVCDFACQRVSEYPEYKIDPVVYSGQQVIDKYYEHVMKESQVISAIFADDQNVHPLTDTQQTDYYSTTTCGECGEGFAKSNHNIRHQNNVTGQYLFLAFNKCNKTLQITNRKIKVTQCQVPNKKPKFDGDMEWTIIRKTFFFQSFFIT